jgi:hypothetical protein
MKAKRLAQMLREFAELTDYERSHELYRLADFIDDPAETSFARFKRLKSSSRYPSALKATLVSVHKTLTAGGAKHQARVVEDLLASFAGSPGATLEDFLREVSDCEERRIPEGKNINYKLADALVSALNRPSLDDASLQKLIARLNSRSVNRDTFALIAKHVLGSEHVFQNRETAIGAIMKQRVERFGTPARQAPSAL